MAATSVVKQPAAEGAEGRRRQWVSPLSGSSLFGMNPFALMRQFTDEMDRAFGATQAPNGALWSPSIELQQQDDKLTLTAELPGLKKEDIQVHVDNDMLVIEGERKQEKEEKKEGYSRTERSYGKFYRAIGLPDGAQADKASAECRDGLLTVSVPIAVAQRKAKQIPVK